MSLSLCSASDEIIDWLLIISAPKLRNKHDCAGYSRPLITGPSSSELPGVEKLMEDSESRAFNTIYSLKNLY